DVFTLRDELQLRTINHSHLAMWSSADTYSMGLPNFEILSPSQPVTGWVAISDRSRLEGEVVPHWLSGRIVSLVREICSYFAHGGNGAGQGAVPREEFGGGHPA